MFRSSAPSGWGALLLCGLVLGGCGADDGRAQNYDGPWIRHTIDASERGADGVRVGDANGDGLPDVATGWEHSGVTRVYLHPGVDRVKEPWPAVTVGETPNVEDAVWMDVNRDGAVDVVSSSEGGTRQIFVNFAPPHPGDFLEPSAWRTEAFPAADGRLWMYALPMDVDGNGAPDLVVGGKRSDAIVGWLESPPDPGSLADWQLHEISPAGWVMSIDAADVNADGKLDLLVSDRASRDVHGVRWLERPAEDDALRDLWRNHLIGARKRSPVFVAPVFGAARTLLGVVVPSGGERLTLYQYESMRGDSWNEIPVRYGHRLGTPKAAGVGDIDLDGVLDVVISCTNLSGWEEGIVWLSHATDSGVDEPEKYSISGAQGLKFDRVELLDLDLDGDLDVMSTEENQDLGVIWYENPLY